MVSALLHISTVPAKFVFNGCLVLVFGFGFWFLFLENERRAGDLILIFYFYFLLFIASDRASLFCFPPSPLPISSNRLYSPLLMTLTLSEAASSKKWILLRRSFLADPKI